ncbi:oxidoreductase [Streptomyces sp. MUM 203J]|uniref:NAD-dependent epimerase/dehydratase family protein n=1 Tax=Streptomyces sp. MUM 203J TaxID=2791990 RepID=UPI001F03AC0C|nr:NAD-dependent epimerase/dehydratase family protein [Streptomyces sp. MUM 203J]MCH0542181.1 oxidoreductase [Streptomyces sp. MUM 203J]
MEILILGGTAWLGRELSREAIRRGHRATCLARGESGQVTEGARLVTADRSGPAPYAPLLDRTWDAVFEVSWQPGFVRDALAALGGRARHWTYVSSINAYASHSEPDADESAPLLGPTAEREADRTLYGEAKVACEQASAEAVGDRLLTVRPGLIGGPGDPSGRSGYWVARAARAPKSPLLVPDTPRLPTQTIDVRDLTAWLMTMAEERAAGTYDAVGRTTPFADWIAASREIGGHTGPVVPAPSNWLLAQGVAQYMGPESLPQWLVEPGSEGWSTRNGTAARKTGLGLRPLTETLSDTLAWERTQDLHRPRRAGLTPARERELLTALG